MQTFNEWLNENTDESINQFKRELCLSIYENILPHLISTEKILVRWTDEWFEKSEEIKIIAKYIKKTQDKEIFAILIPFNTENGSIYKLLDYDYGPNPKTVTKLLASYDKITSDEQQSEGIFYSRNKNVRYDHFNLNGANFYILLPDHIIFMYQEDIDRIKWLIEKGDYRSHKFSKQFGL
jgi:hypothetical protein